MIKKLIGLVVAAAVIAVIVLALLQRGEFRSMLEMIRTEAPAPSAPAIEKVVPIVTAEEIVATEVATLDRADSTAIHTTIGGVDSVAMTQ